MTFESLVKTRPQVVQAFMNAWRDGWQYLMSDASLPEWHRYCKRSGITSADGCQVYTQRLRKILIFEWGKEHIEQLRQFAEFGMRTLGKDFLPRFPEEAFSMQFRIR